MKYIRIFQIPFSLFNVYYIRNYKIKTMLYSSHPLKTKIESPFHIKMGLLKY